MIDEENAFKMVHFVLKARRHQVVHRLFMKLAVHILPARANFGGTLDFGILVRNRQAPFAVDRMFFGRVEYLRVHENARFFDDFPVFLFLQIHDQQPFGHPDLNCRQTNAGGVIHRFEHIID